MLSLRNKCFKQLRTCGCMLKMNKRNCSKSVKDEPEEKEPKQKLGEIGVKYKVFKDADSEVILDVYEERLKYAELLEETEKKEEDVFTGINLQRGLHGVFDIEDLVELLNRESAVDVFVATVPKEIQYCDFICIVSGKSYRHMQAMAQFVRRVYKQKRHENDSIPRLEGENSRDWMALDLGNIALHIFSNEARRKYDLDSLWAVGPKYDKECNKADPIVDMLEKYSIYLHDLKPAR